MTKIYYGCDQPPKNWQRYFSLCNALEFDLSSFEIMPKKQTLNRWRVESPKGFAFVLHCHDGVVRGLLNSKGGALSPELISSWQETVEHAHSLAAKSILIRTPLEFSPSLENRQIMERFATTLAKDAKQSVIWESEGMWSVEDTRKMAESLGLIYAIDPFLADREGIGFTHGDGCFILTERAGLRREFDALDMEQILDWADSYNRLFILLRGRFQWNHARQLRYLLHHGEDN